MSRMRLGLTALLGLGFGAEASADVGASARNWTGFYVGGNVGYGFDADNDVKTTGQAPGNVNNVNGGARPARVSMEPDGFTGGAHVGYNLQFGRAVVGLETDIAYTDFEDKRNVPTTALNGVDRLNNRFEQSLDYLGTVRGRAGYLFGSTMVYATGGLAYGQLDNEAIFFGPAGQRQFQGSSDGVELGYAVGGGVEHALSERWSASFGYMYYDLGEDTVDVAVIPGSGGGGTGYDSEFDTSGHIVRAGFSYRF